MPRSLMGVPFDLDQLAASGVLSPEGLARASTEAATPVDDDVSVGDLVAARLGDELVDRLVEPLLGGVYAGHARRISAAAAVPQLLAMARRGSLLEQASGVPASVAPVFAALPGGMGRLPAPGRRRRWLRGAHLGDRPRAASYAVGLGVDRRPDHERRDHRGRRGRARHPRRGRPPACSARCSRTPRRSSPRSRPPASPSSRWPSGPQDVPDALFDRSGFLVPPVERRDHQGLDVLLRQVGVGARPRPRRRGAPHLARTPPRGGHPPGG